MPPLIMGRDTPLPRPASRPVPGQEDGYKMAADCARSTTPTPTPSASSTSRADWRDSPPGRDPRRPAVVIAREPLTECLPIQRRPEPGGGFSRARRSSRGTRCTASRSSASSRSTSSACATSTSWRSASTWSRHATGDSPRHRRRAARRSGDVRHAAPGRHGGRVPAGRWTGPRVAALAVPDHLRGRRHARRRSTGRARWPRTGATSVPDRKNGRKPVRYPHPTWRTSSPRPTG